MDVAGPAVCLTPAPFSAIAQSIELQSMEFLSEKGGLGRSQPQVGGVFRSEYGLINRVVISLFFYIFGILKVLFDLLLAKQPEIAVGSNVGDLDAPRVDSNKR